MKKIAILLISVFLLAGCTAVRIDTKSIDNIVSVVLSKDNKLYNRVGKGYKYYIPKGVSYIDTDNLNDVLYSEGNYYYLYIDAVSYYYKKDINYVEDKAAYYSKRLSGKKEGYLEIKEVNGKYQIEFFYNYAKIETIVSKKDLEQAVLDISYILSTVKFNDNIISLMLKDDYFTNKEEKYDKFIPKTKIDKNILEVEN